MKKTSLLFAMMVAGTFAMAQENKATVSQTGNNHEAAVTQEGLKNVSSVAITGGNGSEVLVGQTGFKNTAMFEGTNNVKGTQIQKGDRNSAIAGSNNDFGTNSIIHQIQTGNDNVAVSQRWTQSSKIEVYQTQTGNNNTAVANRLRGFDKLVVNQSQEGHDNSALIINTGSAQLYADGGSTTQIQIGNENTADLNTSGGGIGGTYYQEQDGFKNESIIRSSRNTDLASTTQLGNENFARINQFDKYNSAAISQIGDYNEGRISQTGEFNEASLIQDGNNNFGLISQFDGLNTASLTQIGNSNSGTILQTGGNNSATMTQMGNGNMATITQGMK